MIWSTIKSKALLIGGAIISALLVTLKLLAGSRTRAIKKADRLEGALKRQGEIQEIDSELSKELKSHKAEIAKEIESGEEITSLSNPNDWD